MPTSPRLTGKLPGPLSLLALFAVLLVGCAGHNLKPPSLQIQSLHVKSLRLTGAGLDVEFRIRNTNPEPLTIENFEYDLKLNGHDFGKGYHAESTSIAGFDETRVTTRFDINFLRLPGAIKSIFDNDRLDADVRGTFHARHGSKLVKLRVSAAERVPLSK